jgi:hypothetical protein
MRLAGVLFGIMRVLMSVRASRRPPLRIPHSLTGP